MRMILDVSRALAVPTADLDRLLCQIAEISCGMLGCERASIFLHDKVKGELWTKVALKSGEIRLPAHAGIVGHAFTNNQVVCVHDPYQDERFYPSADLQSGFVTRNLLSAPMKGLDGRPIGAIECVNKVGVPFGDADLALIELLADQAGVAIQRHQLQADALRAAALQREMDLARRAQEKLIPKSAPPVKGLKAVGWTLPASATGGDCFDLWRLPDGRLGALLADASGHGLAPAMIVGQARSLIRAMSDLQPDPQTVLDRVNARLCDDLEHNQFVTAFLGFLSPDGLLHLSSAGQAPVLVRKRASEPLIAIDAPIPPLGIVPQWNDPSPAPITIEPGGSLMLVSDGVFEAVNAAGERFGIERVTEVLDRCKHDPPGEVLARLREAVRQWQGGREPLDDETIVVIQREPAESG
jgi:phosphoserine phosphatase RsbU/P